VAVSVNVIAGASRDKISRNRPTGGFLVGKRTEGLENYIPFNIEIFLKDMILVTEKIAKKAAFW
jgi:hypothetical protein